MVNVSTISAKPVSSSQFKILQFNSGQGGQKNNFATNQNRDRSAGSAKLQL